MQRLFTALAPLVVLLGATFCACIAAYGIMQGIGDALPYRKILIKATQFFLVVSIFPLMWLLHFNKSDLGFAARPQFLRQLLRGFGLGFVTLIPVFIVLTLLDVNVVDTTQPWGLVWVSKKLVLELLLALLIAFFEESVFRGILLRGLLNQLSLKIAVPLSAFYYASLHFLDSKTLISQADVTLFSGFTLLSEALHNLLNPHILAAFVALFMVGLCLGLLRTQVRDSLGYCIGCHASWVWQIKLNKSFFNTDYYAAHANWVSSYDGVIGPLVSVWLAFAIVAVFAYRGYTAA